MIALTETATTKVKELIAAEGQPELYLRVAVRPGGCSGLSYEMFFDTEKAADDIVESYGGRPGRRRPRERAAPRRRVARLQGRPAGRGLRDQQPERAAHLRLRPVVLLTFFLDLLDGPLRRAVSRPGPDGAEYGRRDAYGSRSCSTEPCPSPSTPMSNAASRC